MTLGSARALYLLTPDDPVERQTRAARIANKEAADAARLLDNVGAAKDGMYGELARQTATLRTGAETLLVAAGQSRRSMINETDLLRAVAPVLADGLENPLATVMIHWNQTSGAAHARSWTWNVWEQLHPADTAARIWSIPTALAEKAWELWNQRRGSDAPPALPPDGWVPDFNAKTPPDDDSDEAIQRPPWF
ncbi:hypothetical protein BJF81_15670 [Ornithinimicrobium sp. CNJ-824]|uniref:hypothetical protein n=1 Tax=Ornithinimicrobium sp. CNJ-824 TaxID=1904966 RepID=UPI00095B09C4|nr:hypothetical protein [Ornithinimicrobium sp. CNJ-824]OLT21161.1 hypothetical protein BJF81_15670 [Ornithinimicrobium sp. CNJ-824]